MQYIEV